MLAEFPSPNIKNNDLKTDDLEGIWSVIHSKDDWKNDPSETPFDPWDMLESGSSLLTMSGDGLLIIDIISDKTQNTTNLLISKNSHNRFRINMVE